VQCFTFPPTQYRLYGDDFYRSKEPTNSIKVLKEDLQKTTKTTKYTYAQTRIETQKDIHKISTTSPLLGPWANYIHGIKATKNLNDNTIKRRTVYFMQCVSHLEMCITFVVSFGR